MTIHITPGPSPTLRVWRRCPVCSGHPSDGRDVYAWFVGYTQNYYNTIWTCTRCGDSIAGGWVMPRPFRPRWRQESIRDACQAWWQTLT